jgi:hypothetical protein
MLPAFRLFFNIESSLNNFPLRLPPPAPPEKTPRKLFYARPAGRRAGVFTVIKKRRPVRNPSAFLYEAGGKQLFSLTDRFPLSRVKKRNPRFTLPLLLV